VKTYLPVTAGAVPTQENTRPTFLPDGLGDLAGPTQGIVTLPVYLDWSLDSTFDLASRPQVRTLYQTVLSEATGERDLTELIDKQTLVSVWGELVLPRRVRSAWEAAFPELVAC
jgi:hypothetical protein